MSNLATPTYYSPPATARYPWLNKPDTKFDTPGRYKVDLMGPVSLGDEPCTNAKGQQVGGLNDILEPLMALAREEAQEQFDNMSEARRKKSKAAVEMVPFVHDVLDEDDEPTGEIFYKVSTMAGGTRKSDGRPWSRKLTIVDPAGRPTNRMVTGGSIIRAAFTAKPYVMATCAYGVKLYLEAVQVLALGTSNGSASGFGVVGDPFEDEDDDLLPCDVEHAEADLDDEF